MSREKRIEEMAKDLACNICWDEDEIPTINCLETATRLIIKGYRKQSEWISVEERLPECRFVIVCDEYGNVGEAWFNKAGKRFEWSTDEERVFATHWMPLPEAPKMKGGDEE